MSRQQQEPDYIFKMILLGTSAVGKSNILMRFTRDQFCEMHQTTIGVEYATKTVEANGKKVKLQIWDTVGQEQYKAITRTFYKGASAVMLIYDITNERSFLDLEDWYKQIKEYSKNEIVVMLVGNKLDLEEKRVVSKQKAFQYAENKKVAFYQVSAKENVNIGLVFTKIAEELEKLMAEADKIKNTVDTNVDKEKDHREPTNKEVEQKEQKGIQLKKNPPPRKKEKGGCCDK